MVKTCMKCEEPINEDEKFSMILTKKQGKILEMECFHFKCWQEYLEENLKMLQEKE